MSRFLSVLILSLVTIFACACESPKEKAFDAFLQEDGSVLMSSTSGKVYLVSQGKRHLIPDPATGEALGVLSVIHTEKDPFLEAIPIGEELPLLRTKAVESERTREVFLLEAGKRRYIPDPDTITALNMSKRITILPDAAIKLIPLGPALPHMARNG